MGAFKVKERTVKRVIFLFLIKMNISPKFPLKMMGNGDIYFVKHKHEGIP